MKNMKMDNNNCLLASLLAKPAEKPAEAKPVEPKPAEAPAGEKTAAQKALDVIAGLFSKSLEKTNAGLAKLQEANKWDKKPEIK